MKEKRLCLQVEERYLRKIKKTIFLDWVCIFLIIMSGPVRVLFNVIPGYSCNIIIFLLYTSALFIWISQVKRRLLQNEECKFLSGVAALMLFLMAVRTIKFDFFTKWKCICTICLVFILCSADTCGTMDVFCSFIYWKTVSLSIRAKVENTLHSGVHFDRRNYD